MKPQPAILFVLGVGLFAASERVTAQLAIDWFTIDGGGGTSSSDGYSITGTIGQPDAGVMRGYPYTVVGGFWSLVAAVPPPGFSLNVALTETNSVVISWPIAAGNWMLQQSSELGESAHWTEVSPPYSSNATHYFIVASMPVGTRFYQLREKPPMTAN